MRRKSFLVPILEEWNTLRTFTPASAAFGTITNTRIESRRVGDTLQVRSYWACGTVGASTALIALPTGIAIAASKMGTTADAYKLGDGPRLPTGAAGAFPAHLVVFYDGSTTSQVFVTEQSAASVYNKRNGNAVLSNSDGVSLMFEFPVAGWKSHRSIF